MGGPSAPPPPTFKDLAEFRSAIGNKYKSFEDFQSQSKRDSYGKLIYSSNRRFTDEDINRFIAEGKAAGQNARNNPGNRGAKDVFGIPINALSPQELRGIGLGGGNGGGPSFASEDEFRKYASGVVDSKTIAEGEARRLFAEAKADDINTESRLAAERIKANTARDAQRRLQNKGAASAVAGVGASNTRTLLTDAAPFAEALGGAQRRTILGG